ncbi:MAG: TonB-dependent receptor, partial [Pseudomonadales bacterium]|nr:TonB-dependent receptor [Pseudomonadales bacterium]
MRKLLFLACGLYLSLSVMAEQESLETVVVTASRTPVPLNEIGSSVSIISREDLAQSHATHLAGLLREIPGFALSQQGPTGSLAQLRVRGAEANQVLVMIDGIEANDVSQGSDFNFAHMLTDQIQRVEIVRGPQSALWGSDALAGVINIITRPDTRRDNTNELTGSIRAGSFDTKEAALAWQYGSESTSLIVSANRFDTTGTNVSRTGNEEDGYENTTLALAGRTDVADSFVLSWTFRDVDSRSEYDDIDFINTGLPTDAPFVTHSNQTYAGAAAEFSFLDGQIDHIVSMARTESDNVNDTFSPVADRTRADKDQLSWLTNW